MKNLRSLREAAGMTQAELAQKIGVSQVVISQSELGQRSLSLASARAIADALDCTLDELVGRNEGGEK